MFLRQLTVSARTFAPEKTGCLGRASAEKGRKQISPEHLRANRVSTAAALTFLSGYAYFHFFAGEDVQEQETSRADGPPEIRNADNVR
jgi:hypothetical protein